MGEHNREVLIEILGFSREEVENLYAENIITHAPGVDRLKNECPAG